jgi:hypothetical protein
LLLSEPCIQPQGKELVIDYQNLKTDCTLLAEGRW